MLSTNDSKLPISCLTEMVSFKSGNYTWRLAEHFNWGIVDVTEYDQADASIQIIMRWEKIKI